MTPRLSTQQRAWLLGLQQQIKPPSPHRAWLLREQLAKAAPEVRAAFHAGKAASPSAPVPTSAQLLGLVVAQLAGGLS